MTTLAWDGATLAADRRMDTGNGFTACSKIHKCGRFWYGDAGGAADAEMCKEWLSGGAKPDERPELSAPGQHGLAVEARTGHLFIVEGARPTLVRVMDPQFAVGSGGDFARAAMAFGKTAVEAVEFAAKFDSNTGNGTEHVVIRKRPGAKRK